MAENEKELSIEQSRLVCQALGRLAADHNVTQVSIPDKTRYQQGIISRLFSGHYSPRLEIFFTVLTAINELSGQPFTLKDINLPSTNA
ncbi:hypothetical protein GCM10027341_27200 [Spirosoma knui]